VCQIARIVLIQRDELPCGLKASKGEGGGICVVTVLISKAAHAEDQVVACHRRVEGGFVNKGEKVSYVVEEKVDAAVELGERREPVVWDVVGVFRWGKFDTLS
jgi:hypothetical protein